MLLEDVQLSSTSASDVREEEVLIYQLINQYAATSISSLKTFYPDFTIRDQNIKKVVTTYQVTTNIQNEVISLDMATIIFPTILLVLISVVLMSKRAAN